ncbi:uncharacterized protein LOC142345622 [Convolutriloba macropyga]|uniref:uncharacterized protein LOC142345622 n=1 Tax=Convolutriloba macropyga TaxID=536237 RepID=UPI003F522FEB
MFANFNSWIKTDITSTGDKFLSQLFDSVAKRENKLVKDYIINYITEHPEWKFEDFAIGQRGLLHHASGSGNLAVVKYLTNELNFPTDQLAEFESAKGTKLKNVSALYTAAANGNLSVVAHLLQKNADVNQVSANKETTLVSACSAGNIDMAQFLIESGANLEISKTGNVSPLMVACQNENLEVAQLLIEYGAELSHDDINGYSAAFYCATNQSDCVMDYLLQKDPTLLGQKSKFGENLVAYTALNGSSAIVDFIMGKFVNTENENKFISDADKIEFLELLACSKFLRKTFSKEGVKLLKQAHDLRAQAGCAKNSENFPFENETVSEFEGFESFEKAVENLDFDFVHIQTFLIMKRILGLNHSMTLTSVRNYLKNVTEAKKFQSFYDFAINNSVVNNENCSQIRDLIEDHANFCGTQKAFTANDVILSLHKSRDLLAYFSENQENDYGSSTITSEEKQAFLASICRFILAFLTNESTQDSDRSELSSTLEEIAKISESSDEMNFALLRLILDPSTYKMKLGKRMADYPNQDAIEIIANASKVVETDTKRTVLDGFKQNFERLCTSKQRNAIYEVLGNNIEE